MERLSLYFTGPRQVELRAEKQPEPEPGQVLVRALYSAISPGTEMLIYRGQFPSGLPLDVSLPALTGTFAYPVRYGYAIVGEVVQVGQGVNESWLGRRIFAFQPHASHFVSPLSELHPLPEAVSPLEALFLPNVETAVNFLMDGAPVIGEVVAVLGQGVVGLLTTALLASFPLTYLVTADRYPLRRQASLALGAHASFNPDEIGSSKSILATDWSQRGVHAETRPVLSAGTADHGADLVYELTGDPAALDLAIELCGFGGRVVVGSWYGDKRAPIDLGGKFHRSRIRLISSQVSTLDPRFSARWDKARRLGIAWEMLRRIRPAGVIEETSQEPAQSSRSGRISLITHTFPFERAAEAYHLLDEQPEKTIQVVMRY